MNKLLLAKVSCHHGMMGFENQLEPAKQLTDYDMIEIDFIYNGQYISSHDYDEESINKGSSLEGWIDFIMEKNKILWINLKDDNISIFLPQLSNLNIKELFNILDDCLLKYPSLNQHIIIGCQYHTIYEQLCHNKNYIVIRDLPRDTFYVMDMLTPHFLSEEVKLLMQDEIVKDVGDAKIIAIDHRFFTNTLTEFINHCTAHIIIIYTVDRSFNILTNKHIIYQYDY